MIAARERLSPRRASSTIEVEGRAAQVVWPMTAPAAQPVAVQLLAQAIERIRSELDRAKPINERVRVFWANVAARDLGTAEVRERFWQLAIDVGLYADLGRHPPHAAKETIEHLIRWGLLERNPFGKT
jgi:hypothetical protein